MEGFGNMVFRQAHRACPTGDQGWMMEGLVVTGSMTPSGLIAYCC